MSEATESTFTGVQRFLSVVCGYAVPHIYPQSDFLVAFPPELIMELITDAKLRAVILQKTIGTNLVVAEKKTPTSAGEDLKIAVDANVTTPERVLELFGPDDRVKYLDQQDLWTFVATGKFWELESELPKKPRDATKLIALMLSTALELDLLTPEELVSAIGFEVLLEKETKEGLIKAVKVLTKVGSDNGYRALIDIYSPDRIVELVSIQLIWEIVIHPLVAKRHGLVADAKEPKSQTGSPSSFQPVVQPEVPEAPVRIPESSPIASLAVLASDSKKKVLGPTFGSPLAFAGRASSVPASHVSPSSIAPVSSGKEGAPTDPKESKASVSDDSDVTANVADEVSGSDSVVTDDGEDNVSDDELIQGGDEPGVSKPEDEIVVTVSIPEADQVADLSEASESDRESVLPLVLQTRSSSSASVVRSPSSSMPAVRLPPRPSSDPRPLPTGDAEVLVEVGYVRQEDEDVLAALEEEDTRVTPEPIPTGGRPRKNTGTSQISDEAFINAGGVTRANSITTSEEPSITPVNDKVALCQLLRSKDTGLKLEGINPFESQTHQILLTAIEELDPGLFGDRRQEINESNNLDLGNILCSTLESRSPISAISLRALLVTIGCATRHSVMQKPVVSSGSPPPLPSTKTPQPGRLFGRKSR